MKAIYGILILVPVLACREDPGSYDYSPHEGLRDQSASEFLPGPTPYVADIPRLYIDPALYEPVGDERIFPLNGRNSFVFVFDTNNDGTGEFTVNPSGSEFSSDRVQGEESARIVHAGKTFYGIGYFWYRPRDVSQFSTFNISLKSTSASTSTFEEIILGFESGAAFPSVTVAVSIDASEYGYLNDGDWHSLTIPVSDLVERGWDPTSVRVPLTLTGGAGEFGDAFLVDDVYYQ